MDGPLQGRQIVVQYSHTLIPFYKKVFRTADDAINYIVIAMEFSKNIVLELQDNAR